METPLWLTIIDIVIVGALVGLGTLLWRIRTDLRTEALKNREEILEQLKADREEDDRRWQRVFSQLKPALELESTIAVDVANKYYRPLLDAVHRANIYIDIYEEVEDLVRDSRYFKKNGSLPLDIKENVRNFLESQTNRDPNELLKDMEGARKSWAKYLCSELKSLYSAVEAFKKFGYMSELAEIEGIGNDYIKKLLNIYYASDIPSWSDDPDPEEISRFLKSWKFHELEALRALKDNIPWEIFLSHYLKRLTKALRSGASTSPNSG